MRRLILNRLQGRFSKLVKIYLNSNGLKQGELAKIVGIQRTHLNLLMSGKRNLSGYYVFQFIRSGIFKMKDIYDGKPESTREHDFWKTAAEAENIALLSRIAKLRENGIDVDGLLNMIDPNYKSD